MSKMQRGFEESDKGATPPKTNQPTHPWPTSRSLSLLAMEDAGSVRLPVDGTVPASTLLPAVESVLPLIPRYVLAWPRTGPLLTSDAHFNSMPIKRTYGRSSVAAVKQAKR